MTDPGLPTAEEIKSRIEDAIAEKEAEPKARIDFARAPSLTAIVYRFRNGRKVTSLVPDGWFAIVGADGVYAAHHAEPARFCPFGDLPRPFEDWPPA